MTGRSRRARPGLARALMALVAAGFRVAPYRPLPMRVFLLEVTGVPPAEAKAVASRGGACRACQRTTNAFFPGPPRPDPQESAP